jgi:hypothetical protein
MLRPLLECAVPENLQIDETDANAGTPQNKNAGKDIKAELRAVAGGTGGH